MFTSYQSKSAYLQIQSRFNSISLFSPMKVVLLATNTSEKAFSTDTRLGNPLGKETSRERRSKSKIRAFFQRRSYCSPNSKHVPNDTFMVSFRSYTLIDGRCLTTCTIRMTKFINAVSDTVCKPLSISIFRIAEQSQQMKELNYINRYVGSSHTQTSS